MGAECLAWAVLVVCIAVMHCQCHGAEALTQHGTIDVSQPRQISYMGRFAFDTSSEADAWEAVHWLWNLTYDADGQRLPDGPDDEKLQELTTAAFMHLQHVGGSPPEYILAHNDQQVESDAILDEGLRGGDTESVSCEHLVSTALRAWHVGTGYEEFPITRVMWQQARPRFWFISAVNCESPSETATRLLSGNSNEFEYSLHFRNPGGHFAREFSKEEQGVWEARIAASVVYVPWAVWAVYVSLVRFRTLQIATGFRVMAAILSLQAAALVLQVFSAASFASDGVVVVPVETIASFLDAAAECLLMLLLVAFMKGWTTVRAGVRLRHKVIGCLIFCAILVLYVLILVWSSLGGTPASALYLYDSPPGVIIVALRCSVLLWFAWSARKRIIKAVGEPEQRKYFRTVMAQGAMWYLTLPLTVAVAGAMPPWNKARVVTIVDLLASTIALGVLLQSLWPARLNDAFNSVQDLAITAGATGDVAITSRRQARAEHERRAAQAEGWRMAKELDASRSAPRRTRGTGIVVDQGVELRGRMREDSENGFEERVVRDQVGRLDRRGY